MHHKICNAVGAIQPPLWVKTTCDVLGTGVDITLVSTDVEGSTELWEWVSIFILILTLVVVLTQTARQATTRHDSMA